MKYIKVHSFLIAACFIACTACNGDDDFSGKETQAKDSAQQATPVAYSKEPGMVGVFDVPEMLVLSKMDSAAAKDMAFQLAKGYSALQEDMIAIGAEMVGSPGVVNYNNDVNNLKFECILVIRSMPATQPKQSTIVALEASKMLVYNYYGPYQDLGNAYAEIRKLFTENKLEQTGPMREFYITDPTVEKDPSKWLTRVMVPVDDAKDIK